MGAWGEMPWDGVLRDGADGAGAGGGKCMLERFYPDREAESAYGIDYSAYYESGFRGIIFDVDNTLVPHGAPADERAAALFGKPGSYEEIFASLRDAVGGGGGTG